MNTLPYHEPELLRQIAAGDTLAFEQLVRHWQSRLFTYIHKITQSREQSRDLVQDIFLTLWNRREKLPEINLLNAYLHQMARHAVYHSLQRTAREELALHLLTVGQAETTGPDADSLVLSKEIRQQIQEVIDRMSPRQREIFVLSRGQGLSHEEIAEKLGIGYNTIRYHIAEALKFLREELGREYGKDGLVIFLIYCWAQG